MSDIPDAFMKVAWEALAGFTKTQQVANVARALMAAAKEADEAATKQERERCAEIVRSFMRTGRW